MFLFINKKIVAGAILCLGIVAAAATWLFSNPQAIDAQGLIPFAGYPTYIEYNCLCSGSIMVTIEPTEGMRQQGHQTMNYLYVWAADLLSDYMPSGMPIPTAYLWCGIAWTGSHTLLGNYVPGSFPCAAYVGTGCSITGYAQGAILNVGSSAF